MKKYVVVLLAWFAVKSFAGEFPRTMFVENSLGRTLSTLNLETGAIHNNVLTLGQVPNQILAYRDKVYVLNSVPAEIMVIEATSLQIKTRIALPEGSNPYAMALVGLNRVYVTLLVGDAVAVVDVKEKKVSKLIPCGIAPQGILLDGEQAIIANTGGYPTYKASSITFIDVRTDSVVNTVAVPSNPQVVRKGPDWNYYVLCSGIWGKNNGQVAVINPYAPPTYNSPACVDTFLVGGFPGDLAVLPNGMAYISDWGDMTGGFLYKVNVYLGEILRNAQNPLRVGRGAMRLFWDKKTAGLYVSAFDQDVVQKYDVELDKVLATYPMGDGAQDMAIVEKMEATDPWADEVAAFVPGQPWSKSGFDYFPDNVLGPPNPDRAINAWYGSSDPQEIFSLGHGGWITLAFTDNVVADGPGVDFIIFENVFMNLWTGKPFIEAASVAVSQDGVHFVEFPYDTLTCKGLAGAHAIKSTSRPTDPDSSGGDQFDLAEVGLAWIRYVRITDMGDRWQEGPYNKDFDLDAVVAVNSRTAVVAMNEEQRISHFELAANYPNPFNSQTTLQYKVAEPGPIEVAVYNMNGQLVAVLEQRQAMPGAYRAVWDGRDATAASVSSGVYWAVLRAGPEIFHQKMVLIK